MSTVILKTYDYLKKHKIVCFLLFFFASSMLAFSLLHINYKEDISDFLPLQGTSKNALNVYQNISGTNNIVAIFQLSDSSESDPDILVDGISSFLSRIDEIDSLHSRLRVISQVDLGQMSEVSEFVYENIPFFLTEKDYNRIDSLLEIPGYIEDQLQHNKQMMLMPGGGLLAENIGRDPLNLFTPVVTKLHGSTEALNYEIYDGYIFSPDMEKAFVIISSPYGSSETDKNGQAVQYMVNKSNDGQYSYNPCTGTSVANMPVGDIVFHRDVIESGAPIFMWNVDATEIQMLAYSGIKEVTRAVKLYCGSDSYNFPTIFVVFHSGAIHSGATR